MLYSIKNVYKETKKRKLIKIEIKEEMLFRLDMVLMQKVNLHF